MKKALYFSACTLVALLAAHPASADEPARRWYAGADFMGNKISGYPTVGNVSGSDVFNTSASGYNVYGGYQMTQSFGMELGYFSTSKATKNFDASVFDPSFAGIPVKTDVSFKSFYMDLVGNYPLAEPFYLLGSVGASWMSVDATSSVLGQDTGITDSAFALRAGGGVEMAIIDNLNARAMLHYNYPLGDGTKLLQYSLGLNYGF